MTRTDFLAAVHALAEQLGRQLWTLIEQQTDAARAEALVIATSQLRAQIVGDQPPTCEETPADQSRGRRNPPRCTVCDELGHNARRHRKDQPQAIVVPAPPPTLAPVPAPDDEDDEPDAAPLSPPPYTARPLRQHRGRGGQAPSSKRCMTCHDRSRYRPATTACSAPWTRAPTCRRRAGGGRQT